MDGYVEPNGRAPIEMMSKFLVLVSEGNMSEALKLSLEIREIEPENKLILQYIATLKEYINQENEDNIDDDDNDEDSDGDDEDDDDDENFSEDKYTDLDEASDDEGDQNFDDSELKLASK